MRQEEISSSTQLLEQFGLRQAVLIDSSCETIVLLCHDFARRIWDSPRLWKFTDHGLSHSYRLLSRLLDLSTYLGWETGAHLSDYERLIAVLAGLLHDIGLQYNNHVDRRRPDRADLSDAEIRGLHCVLGHEMIIDTADKVTREDRGLPSLLQDEPGRPTLVAHVCKVAFAHQGGPRWDALAREPLDDRQFNRSFRPRLLAALVRLADELDCDCRRVPKLFELNKQDLPTESKMHWAACHYVQDVEVRAEKGVRVTVTWRAPISGEKEESEEIALIDDLIQSTRIQHIEKEFDNCSSYLVSSESNGLPPAYRVFAQGPRVVDDLDHLPPDVADLLLQRKRLMEPDHEVPLSNVMRLPAPESIRTRATELVVPDLYGMHVVLESGLHTDTFLKCRALVTDRDFVADLVDCLFNHYQPKGVNGVCAIGTSAITVAAMLAQRLRAALTFTFGGKDRKQRYDPFEWEPRLLSGSRVLIMDDILAEGRVALQTIDFIREFHPDAVYYFAFFSLGTRKEHLQAVPDVIFRYLCHKANVQYWPGKDGLCDDCKDQPRKRRFEYPPDPSYPADQYPIYATYPEDVEAYYDHPHER